MRCSKVRALVPLFLDRLLPVADHRAVTAHLEECPACARLLEELEQPLQPPDPVPTVLMSRLSQELDDAIFHQIDQLDRGPDASRPSHQGLPGALWWLSGAAAGAVVSWALVSFYAIPAPPSPQAQSQAAPAQLPTRLEPAAELPLTGSETSPPLGEASSQLLEWLQTPPLQTPAELARPVMVEAQLVEPLPARALPPPTLSSLHEGY